MIDILLAEPPRVVQIQRRCWAAAYESWDRANAAQFGTPLGSNQLEMARWFDNGRGLSGQQGAATNNGLALLQRIGFMKVRSRAGGSVTDIIFGELLQSSYVYCAYSWPARSGVAAGSHALVIYGVQKGTLFIMDPAATRGFVREPISFFNRPGINVAFGVSWLSDLGRSLDHSLAALR